MLKNFLRFLVCLILFQLIIEVKSQKAPFNPIRRASHTVTVINGKLYILGGYSVPSTQDVVCGKQFFYLDVSVPFNTKEIKWVDLTNINTVPSHRRGGSMVIDNNTLLLYGGEQASGGELELFYTFDTQSNSWDIPKMTGNYIPKRKSGLIPIMSNNKKVYLFGGFTKGAFDANKDNYASDMTILDLTDYSLEQVNSTDAPTSRGFYGAVLLPNQKIIYIGGTSETVEDFPLNEVYLYDTINNKWSSQMTTGKIPSNRNSMSAVLGLDGQRVIIYGGTEKVNPGPTVPDINPLDSLYELNINNWEWYIPKVSGNPPPATTFSHKAAVIGKYMVVTFGNINNQENQADLNVFSVLDISNNDEYKWSNIFTPPDPTSTSTSDTPASPTSPTSETAPVTPSNAESPTKSKSTDNPGVLVGIILGSLAGIIILFVCFYRGKLIRFGKNALRISGGVVISTPGSNDTVIPTPGSDVLRTSRSAVIPTPGSDALRTSRSAVIPTPGSDALRTSGSAVIPTPGSVTIPIPSDVAF